MNILRKSFWISGLIALGCLLIVGLPTNTLADQDGDGLTPELEATGFGLRLGFDLWDAANRDWKNSEDSILIPGSDNCPSQDGLGCLSDSKPDVFVILRLAEPSNIQLELCDIFSLGKKPTSDGGLGFNIWVLREAPNYVSPDRRFSDLSDQKAVVLWEESLSTALAFTGWSEYGTIMDEGKGSATIYTGKIVQNILDAASIDSEVQSASGAYNSQPPYADGCLQCLHFQNTTIHELLHVMWTLENDLKNVYSHHITRGAYIMNPAIVTTEKKGTVTYYIPEVASSTTQATWSLSALPR